MIVGGPQAHLFQRGLNVVDVIVVCALIVLALAATVAAVILWLRSRRDPQPAIGTQLTTEAVGRLRGRLRALTARIPRHRSLTYSDFPAISAAGAIEAWLLQQKPRNALAAATIAVKSAPYDWRVRLHLARTHFYCQDLEAAAKELVKARMLGDTSPAQDYLEARIRLASAESGLQAPAADENDAEARLRFESAEALDLLLDVVERDPAFVDAAFHAGILALRLGLRDEARELLDQLQPLMDVSLERDQYLQVMNHLN
jgi:hypothetical protein